MFELARVCHVSLMPKELLLVVVKRGGLWEVGVPRGEWISDRAIFGYSVSSSVHWLFLIVK